MSGLDKRTCAVFLPRRMQATDTKRLHRDIPTWRIAGHLLRFTAAGLIMTIISTVVCALFVYINHEESAYWNETSTIAFQSGAFRQVDDEYEFPDYVQQPPVDSALPPFEDRYAIRRVRDRRGWPWQCMQMEIWESRWNSVSDPLAYTTGEQVIDFGRGCLLIGLSAQTIIDDAFWTRRANERPYILLPSKPVWPGAIGDVIFYAMLAYVVTTIRRECITSLRRHRGQCLSCGYVLIATASGACSECGSRYAQPSRADS